MTIKTHTITFNSSLGMGVILTLNLTDGSVVSIPCHNRATAAYFVRNWNTVDVQKMAASWAS
jgi:hypothetical protein